jgi:hypothetical protein
MAVVHRKIAALPDADRSAFVLCVLEGLTQAEAATRLGRTPGAGAGQVGRAKQRLMARLTRWGVPSLVVLGTAAVARAVPRGLMERSLELTESGVPPTILRLATGGLEMIASSTKLLLVAAAVAAGLTAGLLAASGRTPETPPAAGVKSAEPAEVPPGRKAAENPPMPGQETKPRRLVGPVLDFVRLAEVDGAADKFTIVRTVMEYVTRLAEVDAEREGKTVRERREVTAAETREITEGYTLKYFRLTDRRGAAVEWGKAAGKVVLLHRSNQLPDQGILKMLSKDAIILYGRD